MGWLPINANAKPSPLEKAFMHLALDGGAGRKAPHLANPIAPTEENLMAGMKLFKGDCAGCHGDANNAAKPKAFCIPVRGCLRCIRRRSRIISCSGSSKAACGIRG